MSGFNFEYRPDPEREKRQQKVDAARAALTKAQDAIGAAMRSGNLAEREAAFAASDDAYRALNDAEAELRHPSEPISRTEAHRRAAEESVYGRRSRR